jgi:DNA-binding NtrC family response regulator
MRQKTRKPDFPILVVDDENHSLKSFELSLRSHGLDNIILCQDSMRVMDILKKNEIEVILLDILMPGLTGEELLGKIAEQYPEIPVFMVTGINEVETAVRCMQSGAFDYVLKPVEKERLISSVNKAIELRHLRRENERLTEQFFSETVGRPDAFAHIVTRNRKMVSIFKYCEAIGGGNHPILITGETGVGKELVAEAIHAISGRGKEMVAINIAGLDDTVFSDTLFGHIKGAFTGAASIRRGFIEKAGDGSIFLDEIGDLLSASQVKLLRLLDKREYVPVGSDMAKATNARFIFATNKDLAGLVKSGAFRKDLFFRLRTHHIHIPPLRERPDDLPLLLEYFITLAAEEFQKNIPAFGSELVSYLTQYRFPGNVRELMSMVFDAVGRNRADILSPSLFANAIEKSGRDLIELSSPVLTSAAGSGRPWFSQLVPLPKLKELTEDLIAEALRRSKNNQRQAARMMGITPQALNQRLKRK